MKQKKKKEKTRKKKKKKAWDLGSSRNHLRTLIHYTFNQKIFIILPQTKTRRSYISLAIDVARYEAKDLAVATAIEERGK